MKIHGPNQTNFNPYKNQIQKQADYKKNVNQKDQLEISTQAKQLQESENIHPKREAYVQEIKNAVESGEYKINHEKTAQKMIDFWSNR
ncbi:flagellar biosynthesis anti-sigma factor FlgM [Ornithinibacillus sp. L9]|uniref:Negative regulator of flagellin synthesis n=1 Tax=Ornithinibacillus caprae TaxID=2678566 RepID=A0A6N8FPD7_9BACI|nr:flagellar biosynthesis anti-sigma factor FlgM [Ornithinibacillus caprae]MUK90806.1 flagellar biosynthesis anti-sigma factor FlgM [Ornithinibacillus caprae]